MISVVIPLYNKQQFIAETIESVLAQSFRDFELLVVNDGSTDGSLAIVESIQDDRIRLIDSKHSGVSAARNRGIEVSNHNWIAFLDADDWWDENFLAEMIASIHSYPENKLFASGRTHVFADSEKRYSNPFLPKEGTDGAVNFFKVISRHLPLINSSNVIISKSLIQQVGFFREAQKMHEDHDLWMRLSIGEEVVFKNKNLSFYRNTQSDSASKMYYEPNDFSTFLKTLIHTRERLTNSEKINFKKYANRFVTLTYIKNYAHYSALEDKEVINLAKRLVTGKYRLLLRCLYWIPYNKTYRIFKFFQIQ